MTRGPLPASGAHRFGPAGEVPRAHTLSLPAKIIRYLGTLTLAGGDRDGEAFEVLAWERRFVRGAFGQPGHAALTVGRGNGKSALVAGIAAAVVDPAGPLHGRRRECVAVASSFDQSKVIFEDVLAFLRERYDLGNRKRWRVQDSANRATIEWRETGARVRTIGSDPAKAHGLRPALALLDEPAQWDSAKSERMLAAIRTGLGKVPGSKMIALGTRPAGDAHWFAKMLTGSGVGYAQTHAARERDRPFLLSTIRRANPSVDHLPSLKAELQEEREIAKSDPASFASWRALRLNAGVSDVQESYLLDAGTWERIEGEAPIEGRPVWGVDLSTSAAMSAVAAWWPSGRLEVVAAFPREPSLAERGLQDGVGRLYTEMHQRGELILAGDNAVNIADLLVEAVERFGAPRAIAADRWREAELRDALKAARVPMAALELRGMGYKDGGEDVERFRRAVGEGKVIPFPSLLMTAAMSEARCMVDPAGNAKLCKNVEGGRRRRAKDDAAAAGILAVAAGTRRLARSGGGGAYLGAA